MIVSGDLVELLITLSEVRSKIADLREMESDLESRIRELSSDDHQLVTHEGQSVASIERTKRFDAKRAKEVLTATELVLVSDTRVTISADKAKKLLPQDRYEMCRIEVGSPKIKLAGE